MFRVFSLLVFCFIGLFLQSSVLHSNFPGIIVPDFVAIAIVALVLRQPGLMGLLFSFALGLLSDFASGAYIGANAAGTVIAFCLAISIAKRVFAEHLVAIASIAFWTTLLKSVSALALLTVYVSTDYIEVFSTVKALGEAILTALVAPLCIKLILPAKRNSTRKSTQLSANKSSPSRKRRGRKRA